MFKFRSSSSTVDKILARRIKEGTAQLISLHPDSCRAAYIRRRVDRVNQELKKLERSKTALLSSLLYNPATDQHTFIFNFETTTILLDPAAGKDLNLTPDFLTSASLDQKIIQKEDLAKISKTPSISHIVLFVPGDLPS